MQKLYIEGTDIAPNERKAILERLKKAQGNLKEYVLNSTQWFRVPNLHFKFDDTLHCVNNLNFIFAQLEREKQKKE